MVHNFFTEQPVESARTYYLHPILHCPDEKSQVGIDEFDAGYEGRNEQDLEE
jgi:hypothetical protein